jgi:hypothetical protein
LALLTGDISFFAFFLENCLDPTGFSNDEMRMNYSSSSYSLLKKNEKTKLQSVAFCVAFCGLGEGNTVGPPTNQVAEIKSCMYECKILGRIKDLT